MERTGTVIEIKEDIAVVKCSGACPGECKGCTMGHLFGSPGSDENFLEARNEAGGQVGDMVKIELDTVPSLAAYSIAYGIPMMGLVVGALLGTYANRFLQMNENLVIFLFVCLGVAVSFLMVIYLSKKFKAVPSVTSIISRKNNSSPE